MISYYFKMSRSIQYICFCVVTLITIVSSVEECVKIDSCSCQNSSGVLDLSPLASSDGEPRFKNFENKLGTNYYSWNPCTPFTEDPTKCNNVSGCKTNMDTYHSLGTQDSATFVTDKKKGLMLRYETGGPLVRRLEVILVCDPSTNASLSVKGETFPASLNHEITLRSIYCCFDSNGTSTTEPSTSFTDSTPGSNTSSSSELPSGSTDSSSGSTMPVSGSTNPNTGSTNPDTGSTNPDTGSTNPATGSTNPATGSTMTTPGSAAPTIIPFPKCVVIAVMILLKFVF